MRIFFFVTMSNGDEIWENFKGRTKPLKQKKVVATHDNLHKIKVEKNASFHPLPSAQYNKEDIKDIAPIERRMYDKIKNNNLCIEGRIDLHGYSIDQARVMVIQFINSSYNLGKRLLCIITGKGKHSEFPNLTLNQVVPNILKHEADTNNKIAYLGSALPKDGGEGAYYIYLKRNKRLK